MVKKTKTKGCEICGEITKLQNHHLVPKNVIRRRRGKPGWREKVIRICHECHISIHEAYLNHVHMSTTRLGFCKFNCVKFSLLKKYLKVQHPLIWKNWASEMNEFIEDSMEAFSKENLEDEW